MIQIDSIIPLTDFKRKTAELREKLRRTGEPTVLTVEGRAEMVVQDAAAYQRLIERLARAEAFIGIGEGLESARLGRGRPAPEFFGELRQRLTRRRKKTA